MYQTYITLTTKEASLTKEASFTCHRHQLVLVDQEYALDIYFVGTMIRLRFMTKGQCTSLKTHSTEAHCVLWSQLILITAVYTCGSKLVIYWTRLKWRQVGSARDPRFLNDLYTFSGRFSRRQESHNHVVKAYAILLSNNSSRKVKWK
jgi:hypothetical protein